MINFNGDIVLVDSSGQIRVTNGDLTLRADDTGLRDVILGSGLTLRPEIGYVMSLGALDQRWLNVYTSVLDADTVGAISASFGPGAVGFVGGAVFSNGNIFIHPLVQVIPSFDASDLFGGGVILGNQSRRFGAIYAVSGFLETISPKTSGSFTTMNGSFIPDTTLVRNLGRTDARWATLFARDGDFTQRPTVNGSGIAIQGDIVGTSGILTRVQAASGVVVSLDINTQPGSGDYLAWGGSNGTKLQWKQDWIYVILTQDFVTSNSTAQNVTELSFAPSGNKTYEFRAQLMTRTATAGTGPRPGLLWPTGGLDGIVTIRQTSAAATEVIQNGNVNAAVLAPVGGLPNATQSWPATIEGMFRGGTPAPVGRIHVQLASETNGTNVTIKAGSYLAYRELF